MYIINNHSSEKMITYWWLYPWPYESEYYPSHDQHAHAMTSPGGQITKVCMAAPAVTKTIRAGVIASVRGGNKEAACNGQVRLGI